MQATRRSRPEALRRSDELKTSLLRSVSHDLRTPLTSIIAAGAALDSPSVTAEERHELSEAVVERGPAALAPGREPARRLAARDRATPSRTASRSIWPRLLEAARDSIGARGEQVRLALDDDLPALRADPTQLERAFANLLENAVVHGEGQPVLVRSRLVGPRLVVRVVDRGPGIPEGERERIFEPFYRAPARPPAATARASAWRSPTASSRPTGARSRSSRYPGRAPASWSASPRRRRTAAAWSPRAVRRSVSDLPRILVCDDEPQILRALRVILRDAGFEAVTAATGEEALDLAAVKPPEAAILDLMLPDIDGVEVTRRLREWSKMPILVLSAVGEEDRKVEALAAGADDYVTKPFGPRELVARLEAVLRRAAPEGAEPTIVADGLEIDLAARTRQAATASRST